MKVVDTALVLKSVPPERHPWFNQFKHSTSTADHFLVELLSLEKRTLLSEYVKNCSKPDPWVVLCLLKQRNNLNHFDSFKRTCLEYLLQHREICLDSLAVLIYFGQKKMSVL